MREKKIAQLFERFEELEKELADPALFGDQKRYRELTQEHSYLKELKDVSEKRAAVSKQLEDNRELLKEETDPEFLSVIQEEIPQLEAEFEQADNRFEALLIPPDPNDHSNTILELRAGTGGDEAALFVGDCVRMYKLFADKMKWKYEALSATESEVGGFKEYVMVLSGANVYRFLRHEGGTHRVQRVPDTETQGRVHTSAVTVAAFLEPDENVDVDIDEKDLRVDTYRSSGAGGQHVNTTDSAVRLTHIPTGIVTYCQAERSQHKNKDKAMRVLKAKIAEKEAEEQLRAIASDRASQVGSGDRSERVRTYNFPQNRITDHRINYTAYNLDRVMDGEIEPLSLLLVKHHCEQSL